MDDELRQLRAKFADVQRDATQAAKEAAARGGINARNVADLVLTLQRRGMIDVVYTTDGSTVVTRKQVRREVLEETEARGGRLEICELPTLLHLDASAVERAVDELTAEAQGDAALYGDDPGPFRPRFRVVAGEIVTDTYLRRAADRVRTALDESGRCAVVDLARDVDLPVAFTMSFLRLLVAAAATPAVHGITGAAVLTNATLDDGLLYTGRFVALQLRRIVLALNGRSSPGSIGEVAGRCGVYAPVLPAVVARLKAAQDGGKPLVCGSIDGTGAGAHFTPRSFNERRFEAVENFYRTNHFVPYATAAAAGINDPKAFLVQRFNGAAGSAATDAAGGATAGGPRRGGRGGRTDGRRGGGSRGRSGSAAATASAAATGASEACPLFGHALSEAFVADRLLRDLEPHLEELVAGGTSPSLAGSPHDAPTLDLRDFLPPVVDSDADRAAVLARLRTLFPDVAEATDVAGGAVLVRRSAWAAILTPLEGIVREELRRNRKLPAFSRTGDPASCSRRVLLLIARTLHLPCETAGEPGSPLHSVLVCWTPRVADLYESVRSMLKLRGDHGAARVRDFCTGEAERTWTTLFFAARALDQLALKWRAAAVDEDEAPNEAALCAIARHIGARCVVPLARIAMAERIAERPARAFVLPLIVEQPAELLGPEEVLACATAAGSLDLDSVTAGHVVSACPEEERGPLAAIAQLLPKPSRLDAGCDSPAALASLVKRLQEASACNELRLCLHAPGKKAERQLLRDRRSHAVLEAASLPLPDAADASAAPTLLGLAAQLTAAVASTTLLSAPLPLPADPASLHRVLRSIRLASGDGDDACVDAIADALDCLQQQAHASAIAALRRAQAELSLSE